MFEAIIPAKYTLGYMIKFGLLMFRSPGLLISFQNVSKGSIEVVFERNILM